MASLFRAAFPSATLTDEAGNLTPAWRGFFQSLYARTGGSNGVSSDTSALEAELEAERQARIAADQALANGLAAEIAARQQGDANEAQARHSEILSETAARKAADALLVPVEPAPVGGVQFSFPPTTDPGGVCLGSTASHRGRYAGGPPVAPAGGRHGAP